MGVEHQASVVVGAGPCGLAAAAALRRTGVSPLVLERASVVGSSWRGRYDTLRLNTIRWMSHLPGNRMPRRYGDYPTRDQVVGYLEEYARRHALRIQFDTAVERIDRDDGGWRLATSNGPLTTTRVVVATGYDRVPKMPDWPGRESFTGELIHAGEYRSAVPYRGRDVLVVGAGNTGTEIAYYLLEGGAGRVRVSMRTPPNIFPRKWLGMPLNPSAVMLEQLPPRLADRLSQQTQRLIFGDLSPHGLPRAPQGMITTVLERGVAPAVDDGFVAALKRRRIELVPVVERFEGADVVLAGGVRIRPDAVIAASGYARGLEPLVGHLGALRPDGRPVAPAGQPNEDTPGLYFIGYLPVPSGQLRQARIQAKRLACTVARERRRTARSSPAPRAAEAATRPSNENAPGIDDVIVLPDGRSLAYAEFGDPDGRPVLFFHGTPGYRLNPWATDAELRSVGVRLIALDRPGVGRSTSQPHRLLLDWPEDVRRLSDTLELEHFAVVGFSNGGPHAAACAYKLGPRISGTALVAPMRPLHEPGALKQIGVPGWYYPLARRAPWALRPLFSALASLARRDPRRAERILLSDMSEPDRRLFAQPEFAGRLGADLAGAGSRGVVDDERLMPLPWGFEPAQVESPVRLWLGERDELVPAQVWLERSSRFPVCDTTVVPGAGHFVIAEHMLEIIRGV